jgi:hypothetical protein
MFPLPVHNDPAREPFSPRTSAKGSRLRGAASARFFDIPAQAIEAAARAGRDGR